MRQDLRNRIREFRKRFAERRSAAAMASRPPQMHRADTPPDVASARAKSQRHGKVTADHWNQ
jgi:hypothetical protein